MFNQKYKFIKSFILFNNTKPIKIKKGIILQLIWSEKMEAGKPWRYFTGLIPIETKKPKLIEIALPPEYYKNFLQKI
jgi:hypothetical protein